MADRFFTDMPLSPGEFVLDGSEAHHMGTVRRFAPGDRVVLFNGDGAEYPADIVAVSKKQIVLQILGREEPRREVPFPSSSVRRCPRGIASISCWRNWSKSGRRGSFPWRRRARW